MTLRGLFAVMAAVVWAIFLWPVGRQFGWWAGVAGFAGGGFAGLVIGWLFGEWINRLRPHTGWVRTSATMVGGVLGWRAFAALPLWVLSLVRPD